MLCVVNFCLKGGYGGDQGYGQDQGYGNGAQAGYGGVAGHTAGGYGQQGRTINSPSHQNYIKVAKEASESGTAQAASKITTSRITDTVAATAAANKADTVATTHMANKTLVVEVAAVGEVEAAVAADMEEDTTNM